MSERSEKVFLNSARVIIVVRFINDVGMTLVTRIAKPQLLVQLVILYAIPSQC